MLDEDKPVLGLIVSAAGGAEVIRERLVRPLLDRDWLVAVTATPTAFGWLEQLGETAKLEAMTGLPVRHLPRMPGEVSPHPDVDCYAVVPATANTVAKMALGIEDNQALTHLCEAIGSRALPVVVFPRVNLWHVQHPAWPGHLESLRRAGVRLVYGEDVWEWLPPSVTGRELPWSAILDAIAEARPAS
jgi:hypothetical protein